LKEFKAVAEKQSGKRIKIIQSDNAKEYANNYVDNFLKRNGIRHQLSVEYTPQQNGVAEKANRTIVEKAKAKSMLIESGLSKKYWAEAVNTAVYLKNRLPTKALSEAMPEQAWSGGDKVNLSHLSVFESRAFARIPKQKKYKWDQNSRELIFVGYCEDSKAYCLVDPKDPRKIAKARDVQFIEDPTQVKRKETADVFDVISVGIGEDTTVSEQSKSQEDEDVNGNDSDHHSNSENENEGETNNQMQECRYPKVKEKEGNFQI
jgi:hypothetical protein